MSSTEIAASARLASELFDRVLAPLASARQACGANGYFEVARASGAGSYFSTPAVPVMEAADFEFPGGGTADGLIDALIAYWGRSGDAELCALAPGMKQIAAALQEEAVENDGSVSVFCYAMF